MLVTLFRPGLLRIALAAIVFAQHSTRVYLGGMAVLVFFALSGYWVTQMWKHTYAACRQPSLTFIISRAWRLLPAFWLVTLMTLGANSVFAFEVNWPTDAFGRLHEVIANTAILTYADLVPRARLIDQVWSLDIEFQFYIVFAILMMFNGGSCRARPRVLVLLSLVSAAGFLALVIWQEPLRPTLFYYLAFFLAGMWVARTQVIIGRLIAVVALTVVVAVVVSCLCHPQLRGLFLNANRGTSLTRFSYSANCVMAVALLPFALHTVTVPSPSIDRWFGDLSYLVYLLHGPVLNAMGKDFASLPPLRRLPGLLGIWVGVFVASAMILKYYHQPVDQARRRFVSRRRSRTLFNGKGQEASRPA